MRQPWRINDDPMYAVGDIIRYEDGSSALMQVEYISKDHGGKGHHRYYGKQCCGGAVGAYHSSCERPSAEDLKTWDELAKWRRP